MPAYAEETLSLDACGNCYDSNASNIPPGSETFDFTGGMQTFTVPEGITEVTIEVWGAAGENVQSSSGGLGGYASGDLSVAPGDILNVYVGGQNGYNGGGNGGSGGTSGYNGGNGGGASDVRIGGTDLTDRIIVGGGGGGAGRGNGCSNQDGGFGGYPGGQGGFGAGSANKSDDGTLPMAVTQPLVELPVTATHPPAEAAAVAATVVVPVADTALLQVAPTETAVTTTQMTADKEDALASAVTAAPPATAVVAAAAAAGSAAVQVATTGLPAAVGDLPISVA